MVALSWMARHHCLSLNTYPVCLVFDTCFDLLLQKGNVENQKEHLILLLANIDMRKGANAYQSDRHNHVVNILFEASFNITNLE